MSEKQLLRRSEAVQARKVGEDTLILHTLLKQYHVLNQVAGRIWDLVDGSRDADEIAQVLAGEFEEDPDIVRQDVLSTLEGLQALRIIGLQSTG